MMKTSFTQKSGIRQVHPCARADTSTAGLRGETKPKVSDLDSMGLGDDFDSALCDVLAQLPYLIGFVGRVLEIAITKVKKVSKAIIIYVIR